MQRMDKNIKKKHFLNKKIRLIRTTLKGCFYCVHLQPSSHHILSNRGSDGDGCCRSFWDLVQKNKKDKSRQSSFCKIMQKRRKERIRCSWGLAHTLSPRSSLLFHSLPFIACIWALRKKQDPFFLCFYSLPVNTWNIKTHPQNINIFPCLSKVCSEVVYEDMHFAVFCGDPSSPAVQTRTIWNVNKNAKMFRLVIHMQRDLHSGLMSVRNERH